MGPVYIKSLKPSSWLVVPRTNLNRSRSAVTGLIRRTGSTTTTPFFRYCTFGQSPTGIVATSRDSRVTTRRAPSPKTFVTITLLPAGSVVGAAAELTRPAAGRKLKTRNRIEIRGKNRLRTRTTTSKKLVVQVPDGSRSVNVIRCSYHRRPTEPDKSNDVCLCPDNSSIDACCTIIGKGSIRWIIQPMATGTDARYGNLNDSMIVEGQIRGRI